MGLSSLLYRASSTSSLPHPRVYHVHCRVSSLPIVSSYKHGAARSDQCPMHCVLLNVSRCSAKQGNFQAQSQSQAGVPNSPGYPSNMSSSPFPPPQMQQYPSFAPVSPQSPMPQQQQQKPSTPGLPMYQPTGFAGRGGPMGVSGSLSPPIPSGPPPAYGPPFGYPQQQQPQYQQQQQPQQQQQLQQQQPQQPQQQPQPQYQHQQQQPMAFNNGNSRAVSAPPNGNTNQGGYTSTAFTPYQQLPESMPGNGAGQVPYVVTPQGAPAPTSVNLYVPQAQPGWCASGQHLYVVQYGVSVFHS